MAEPQVDPDYIHPNADELAILLNSEEVKAALSNLGSGVAGLVQDSLNAVSNFLKKLG